MGSGLGGFGSLATYGTVAAPADLTTGDLNLDGKRDLVVATAGGVDVLLNVGAGTFGNPTHFPVAAGGCTAIAVGDLNADGKPDVVTANGTSNSIAVLLGNGAGSFAAPTSYPLAGATASGVALA